MKTFLPAPILALAFFAMTWTDGLRASVPVTLTLTPANTSNTYPGVITLNLTGLNTGETVRLEKWLDGNANGLIDSGEILMDSGKISDGEVMIIGGITNISKAFDSNPADGAVTATLNFAPPMTMENIVGREIYRVISPTARFAPVTATFTVTNAATAQRVTGIIYSNGVTPLPYSLVFAIPASGGYAGSAVADVAGHFSLNLNPGTFFLIPSAPNYYCDQSQAAVVVLTNGVTTTNNLSLSPGTVAISGNVYNPSNNNAHEGLMLEMDSGDLLALAFTDTNGNYSAAVTSNFWKIQPIKERLARRALVSPHSALQVDTTAGNVTNANIALPKGNALFYGRITDNSSAPFANIRFEGGDGSNNTFSATGYSDPNGYYAVAVLGNTSSDWNCNANNPENVILGGYILNNSPNTNIAIGQAILQNFVGLPVTAHISGRVVDNFGNPVIGVSLYADQFLGGNNYNSQNADTDNAGNYSLGVASGPWQVYFSTGNEDLASHGLVDLYQPYNVTVPPTNAVLNITVYQEGTPLMNQPARVASGQFGFKINGSIGVNYIVQVSTNLASTNWVNLYSFQLTSNSFPIVDTQATNGARYYRVKKN